MSVKPPPTLIVDQDVPEIFHNDPKSKCFSLRVVLKGAPQTMAITFQLRYAKKGAVLLDELVADQSILERRQSSEQLTLSPNVHKTFRFRISQVSRNHMSKHFKIRISCQHKDGTVACMATTRPIESSTAVTMPTSCNRSQSDWMAWVSLYSARYCSGASNGKCTL